MTEECCTETTGEIVLATTVVKINDKIPFTIGIS